MTNSRLLPGLADSLAASTDAIVQRLNEKELEVGLLGSRDPEAMRREVEQRIRSWEARSGCSNAALVVPNTLRLV